MPTLYDHRGRPVSSADLRRVHADVEEDDYLDPRRDSVASNLTPARLAGLLLAADEGDAEAYYTLAEEMEERDLHYRGVLEQRKNAVVGAPRVVEPYSEDAIDVEIAAAVRELVHEPVFDAYVFDLLDAIAKGVSIVESLWQTDRVWEGRPRWWPRAYLWRDPRWFVWDHRTLSMLGLIDGSVDGAPLPPWKYSVHRPPLKSGLPIRAGLARPVALAYAGKRLGIRGMNRFLEVLGVPPLVAKHKEGASDKDTARLLRVLRKVRSDAVTVIPDSAEIELLDGASGGGGTGAQGFVSVHEWWDRQVSKAVLGQTMTTDDGSSLAQAKVHGRVASQFAASDGRFAASTASRDVITAFVKLNWGERANVPRFAFDLEEPEDLAQLAAVVPAFVKLGLRVPQSWVREKIGIPEPEDGEEELEAPSPPPAPGAPTGTPSPTGDAPGDDDGRAPAAGPEEDETDETNRVQEHVAVPLDGDPESLIDEILRDTLAVQHGRLTRPNVGRLLRAMRASGSYEVALARLQDLSLDTSSLEEALAQALLISHGAGDARDEP